MLFHVLLIKIQNSKPPNYIIKNKLTAIYLEVLNKSKEREKG